MHYVQVVLSFGQVSSNECGISTTKCKPDTSYTVAGSRLRDILFSATDVQTSPATAPMLSREQLLEGFHHFNVPTLPHLLALLLHQSHSFPPPKTGLIVVDCISSLFTLAFPRTTDMKTLQDDASKKNDAIHWAANRRWAVMSDFISKIVKLAATSNIAVLLISQTTTRIRTESDTILHPAISGTAWDTGVHTRLVLFRDWLLERNTRSSQGQYISKARFAGVIKAAGITYDTTSRAIPFTIKQVGGTSSCRC